MEKQEKRFTPLIVQNPNPDLIACKNCLNRDKTIIEIGDKIIPVGITKGICKIFTGPPKDNGKPHEVMFNNKPCKMFSLDYSMVDNVE